MRYIQFIGNIQEQDIRLQYKGKPDEELVEELQLEKVRGSWSEDYWQTTIDNVANAGWKLSFMTTIGEISGGGSYHEPIQGELYPLYTFQKE